MAHREELVDLREDEVDRLNDERDLLLASQPAPTGTRVLSPVEQEAWRQGATQAILSGLATVPRYQAENPELFAEIQQRLFSTGSPSTGFGVPVGQKPPPLGFVRPVGKEQGGPVKFINQATGEVFIAPSAGWTPAPGFVLAGPTATPAPLQAPTPPPAPTGTAPGVPSPSQILPTNPLLIPLPLGGGGSDITLGTSGGTTPGTIPGTTAPTIPPLLNVPAIPTPPAVDVPSFGSLVPGGGGNVTTTVQGLTPQQEFLLNLALPAAAQLAEQPPVLFPGSTIAPRDPLQIQAQEEALKVAGGPIASAGEKALGASEFFLGGGLFPEKTPGFDEATSFLLGDVLFPESNPALERVTEAAIRPLRQVFEETTLPGIRGGAREAGQFGGSRQGIAEGLAARGLATSIGDVTAEIQSDAFRAALEALTETQRTVSQEGVLRTGIASDAALRAIQGLPIATDVALTETRALEAVGIQRREDFQAQLSEAEQRFAAEQLIPFAAAQDVAALAFGIPGGVTQTTQALGTDPVASGAAGFPGVTSGGTGSKVLSGLAGAASGAVLGAQIGSVFGLPGVLVGGVLGGLAGLLFG